MPKIEEFFCNCQREKAYSIKQQRVFLPSMNVDDEAIIRAIKRMNDPDAEPERVESEEESEEVIPHRSAPTYEDPDMERLYQDSALRQHLGIGSSFTGPKGVREDYKFHKKQEKARKQEREQLDFEKLSKKALSSGWMQREIKQEEDKNDDDFLKRYREKRLRELQQEQTRFGSVLELTRNTFVQNIDKEKQDVVIVIHLYENSNQESRIINDLFPQLAIRYPQTKFCKIRASHEDASFDQIALPAILVYQAGELQYTLLRLHDEIPDWNETGRCTLRDLEDYLIIQGVLNQEKSHGRNSTDEEFNSDEDYE
jgi:hypothetical protein